MQILYYACVLQAVHSDSKCVESPSNYHHYTQKLYFTFFNWFVVQMAKIELFFHDYYLPPSIKRNVPCVPEREKEQINIISYICMVINLFFFYFNSGIHAWHTAFDVGRLGTKKKSDNLAIHAQQTKESKIWL